MLALVHISARYHVGKVLEEAREVFPDCVAPRDFDQIVVPLPEKGAPRLIPNGARERGRLRSRRTREPSGVPIRRLDRTSPQFVREGPVDLRRSRAPLPEPPPGLATFTVVL